MDHVLGQILQIQSHLWGGYLLECKLLVPYLIKLICMLSLLLLLLIYFIFRFAFVVVAYLGIGSAYMFFVKKERGVRILPNYDFWAAFLMSVLVS